MRKLVIAVVLAAFAAAPVLAGEPATVTLNVTNMSCELCPLTVSKALRRVKGVVSAKADFASKTAVVSYDPAVTSAQALIRATTDAGFPSTLKK